VVRDLLAQEYLVKAEGLYPILKLTSKSEAVLRGLERVMIIKSKEVVEVKQQNADYETALFQELKVLRRQLADAENVPAYIVLSDATLVELATYFPHNKEEFSKISGFGQLKLEKYSKQFCDVVVRYCRTQNFTSRIHLKAPKRQRKHVRAVTRNFASLQEE
jgi:ATP-dependent DNA helicase RecQ